MNITELARRLKITPNELKQELPKLGFHIGPRAIQIPDEQAKKVMKIWQDRKKKETAVKQIKEKISKQTEKKEVEKTSKTVTIPPSIQVYRLAERLNLPITSVMNELIKNGVLSSVNENLDYEIAAIVAENLGFKVEQGESEQEQAATLVKQKLKQALSEEDKKKLKSRAPVVVVMGHVDHGKTALLDAIRETHVVEEEKGGITQHIGAYSVKKNSHLITFIDTPGHEAFESMRARGGEVADIAVLVIAADDKIQPQTLESIKIIQQEELPLIVAINKIDKADADVEKIKKGLSEINLMPEDWGGKVICVPVSAKEKKGIEDLLEMINLITDMISDKLVANPKGTIIGTVIEAHLDFGLGPVVTLILYNGTLKKGDNVIIGQSYGCIRSIKDQYGESIGTVGASTPVQIFGLKRVPKVGDVVEVVSDNRVFKKRVKQISVSSPAIELSMAALSSVEKASKQEKTKVNYLNIILRADVLGSLEAIVHSLEKLGHPEVKVKIIKKGLGNITESDIDLAKTANAWIIGFGVDIAGPAKQLARELELKVSTHSVIYDLIQGVKEEMNKLLPEEIFEQELGKVEVLRIFQHSNKEIILGGKVTNGKIISNTFIRVWSSKSKEKSDKAEQELKGEGRLAQLQVNKQDVKEVKEGGECGIKFIGQATIEVGDILEVYREIKKKREI